MKSRPVMLRITAESSVARPTQRCSVRYEERRRAECCIGMPMDQMIAGMACKLKK
jgi:hypothetical protein